MRYFFLTTADQVAKKVMNMYTDPNHLQVTDPGQVEGNMVFTYLDIFDSNAQEIAELKAHYQRGGLGDVVLKKRLIQVLNKFLEPIRARRAEFAKDPQAVMEILRKGTSDQKASTRWLARAPCKNVRQGNALVDIIVRK